MFNYAAELLIRSRHEPWYVNKRQNRDAKRIAKTYKARGLDRCIDIQAPGQNLGLVGDDTHYLSFDTA